VDDWFALESMVLLNSNDLSLTSSSLLSMNCCIYGPEANNGPNEAKSHGYNVVGGYWILAVRLVFCICGLEETYTLFVVLSEAVDIWKHLFEVLWKIFIL
jgi:hypothetical protein